MTRAVARRATGPDRRLAVGTVVASAIAAVGGGSVAGASLVVAFVFALAQLVAVSVGVRE